MANAKTRASLEPPKDLSASARARWTSVVPQLARRGEFDRELLTVYCQVWVRWREAEDAIAKTGQLIKSEGKYQRSPFIQLAHQAAQQVRVLEQQLRLGVSENDPEPDPTSGELLTRRQLADRLGVHMMTVTKWEREGLPIAERGRRGRPSTYSESTVRAWRQAKETAAKSPDMLDVMLERARKERAQATLAEQTFQSRSRQLLPAAEVEHEWALHIQAVRTAILATYTTQADRVHRAGVLDGIGGIEAVLKEIAYELLRELATGEEKHTPVPHEAA